MISVKLYNDEVLIAEFDESTYSNSLALESTEKKLNISKQLSVDNYLEEKALLVSGLPMVKVELYLGDLLIRTYTDFKFAAYRIINKTVDSVEQVYEELALHKI